MRTSACFGFIALALGLGALVVGRGVLLPGLCDADGLDPNLARSTAFGLHLRLSEVVLAAALVCTALVPRFLGSRLATTAAFVLVAIASVHRFVMVPKLYGLYARVDLVAARPLDRLREVDAAALEELLVSVAMAGLFCGLVVATVRRLPQSSSQIPTHAEPSITRATGAAPIGMPSA